MMVSSEDVGEAWQSGGLLEAFQAALMTVAEGYGALFRGAVFNTRADDLVTAMRPLTETFRLAGPLIAAGLGISLGFRVGLFQHWRERPDDFWHFVGHLGQYQARTAARAPHGGCGHRCHFGGRIVGGFWWVS